jgi:thiol-disulfide isomerase/thioredoxin
MRRLLLPLVLLAATLLRAADTPLEKEVADLVAGSQVTVVHFWAPWCDNSKAELGPDGWAKFIAANPDAKFVFIAIWHKGQKPEPVLAAAGLGAQPNLLVRTHPNPSRLAADRLNSFLGQPLTWLPTTWIYRDGRLRYALNYGEIHFGILQTLVEDARDSAKWEH